MITTPMTIDRQWLGFFFLRCDWIVLD
jgi:hypothetical protein